jgi:dihydroorotate dehydrogenase electron transfer subunit
LFGPFSKARACRPGHFLHLKIASSDIYLRRAFSVASIDPEKKTVEIILKIFGRGSRVLSRMHKGDAVGFLGPLGVPFKFPSRTEETIMVAGGVGFPPLLFLASAMIAKGYDPKRIHFFYGGRTAADIVERTRLRRLGVDLRAVTEDGTFGGKGLVTAPVEEFITAESEHKFRLFGCGPEGMLKATDALARRLGVPGQISMEAPMPCGIGVCLGCVVPLNSGGHARVCHDGPVFDIGEVAL